MGIPIPHRGLQAVGVLAVACFQWLKSEQIPEAHSGFK